MIPPRYPTLPTLHDPHSERSVANRAAMEAAVADLREKNAVSRALGTDGRFRGMSVALCCTPEGNPPDGCES